MQSRFYINKQTFWIAQGTTSQPSEMCPLSWKQVEQVLDISQSFPTDFFFHMIQYI